MAEKKLDKDTTQDIKFPTFKGRPLVRCGDIIYYGNMSDKYVIMLQIKNTTKLNDMDLSNEVIVGLMLTDPDIRAKDRIVKRSEKVGLYQALDIADIWLTRALEKGSA